MRRVFSLILALAASAAVVSHGQAQEAAPAAAQELKELREMVQQQTKQIELLAEQVGRLTRALETQKPSEALAKPARPAEAAPTVATPTAPAEITKPAPDVTAPTAEPAKGDGVPKAEAVPGTKHVVAKGETLTSIAKHYNISIADLKSANKIDNERKLQIGQILSIPTTAKTPEATDKKENP